jgi:hypothetical protein
MRRNIIDNSIMALALSMIIYSVLKQIGHELTVFRHICIWVDILTVVVLIDVRRSGNA